MIDRSWVRPIIGVVGGLGLIYLYLVVPSPSTTPPCPTRWLLGIPCPGCGTLRAVHHLVHFRIARAFELNPLSTVALPIVATALVWPRRGDRPDWRTRHPRLFSSLCLATALGVAGFWVARLVFSI